jgi:hypothetical protein
MTDQWKQFSQHLEDIISRAITIEPPLPDIQVGTFSSSFYSSPSHHKSQQQQQQQQQQQASNFRTLYTGRKGSSISSPFVHVTSHWPAFPTLGHIHRYSHSTACQQKGVIWERAREEIEQLPEELQTVWRNYIYVEQQEILPYFLRYAHKRAHSELCDIVFAAYMYDQIQASARDLEENSFHTTQTMSAHHRSPSEQGLNTTDVHNDENGEIWQGLCDMFDICYDWFCRRRDNTKERETINKEGLVEPSSQTFTSPHEAYSPPFVLGTTPTGEGPYFQPSSEEEEEEEEEEEKDNEQGGYEDEQVPTKSKGPSLSPYKNIQCQSTLLALYAQQLRTRLQSRFCSAFQMTNPSPSTSPLTKSPSAKTYNNSVCNPYSPESLQFLHELRQLLELCPSSSSFSMDAEMNGFISEVPPIDLESVHALMKDVFSLQVGSFMSHYQWYMCAYEARVLKPWRDTQTVLASRSAQRQKAWSEVENALHQQAMIQDEKYKQAWEHLSAKNPQIRGYNSRTREIGFSSTSLQGSVSTSRTLRSRIQRLINFVTLYFQSDLQCDLSTLIHNWTRDFSAISRQNQWSWAQELLSPSYSPQKRLDHPPSIADYRNNNILSNDSRQRENENGKRRTNENENDERNPQHYSKSPAFSPQVDSPTLPSPSHRPFEANVKEDTRNTQARDAKEKLPGNTLSDDDKQPPYTPQQKTLKGGSLGIAHYH